MQRLYAGGSGALRGRGGDNIARSDQREALRFYQTLRADALTRNRSGQSTPAVEQARQRAEFNSNRPGSADAGTRSGPPRVMRSSTTQRINLVMMRLPWFCSPGCSSCACASTGACNWRRFAPYVQPRYARRYRQLLLSSINITPPAWRKKASG